MNLGVGRLGPGEDFHAFFFFFFNLTLSSASACSTLITCVESGIVQVWNDNDKEASSDPVRLPCLARDGWGRWGPG